MSTAWRSSPGVTLGPASPRTPRPRNALLAELRWRCGRLAPPIWRPILFRSPVLEMLTGCRQLQAPAGRLPPGARGSRIRRSRRKPMKAITKPVPEIASLMAWWSRLGPAPPRRTEPLSRAAMLRPRRPSRLEPWKRFRSRLRPIRTVTRRAAGGCSLLPASCSGPSRRHGIRVNDAVAPTLLRGVQGLVRCRHQPSTVQAIGQERAGADTHRDHTLWDGGSGHRLAHPLR